MHRKGREEGVFVGRRIGVSLCPRLFLHMPCAPVALLRQWKTKKVVITIANFRF